MKKKIFSIIPVALLALMQAQAAVVMDVPQVDIVPGAKAYVYINVDFGKDAYTAYQFDIAYPEGITSLKSDNGLDEPAFVKGNLYSESQGVTSGYTPTGLDRFQCFSVSSSPFTAQSGTLLALPIQASKTLAKGTYQATISPIEFVQTDATPDRPEAITFNIKVGNEVVLSEESIAAPLENSGVNACVKLTLSANMWNPIVLPFDMDEQQVKEAFGVDVELTDFNGIKSTYADAAEEIVTEIVIQLTQTSSIEANHPFLIKVSEDLSEFRVPMVDIRPVKTPSVDMDRIGAGTNKNPYLYNSLIGTYVADFSLASLIAEGDSPLLLINDEFVYATETTPALKAFHAYFDFYDVLSNKDYAPYVIGMSIEGAQTGLDLNQNEATNDDVYNLKGIKVTDNYKGFIIKNGRVILNK